MDHQSSEIFCGVGNAVVHSTPTTERIQRGAEDKEDPTEELSIFTASKDVACLPVPNNSWRSNSSEDWRNTTDTSVHSSLEVPSDVLEACDGMDDASCFSSSPTPETPRAGAQVAGRRVAKRKERKESSASGSSSSWDSDSDSSSSSSPYDTATSTSSTRSHSSSCSCSHSSSCSCSHSSSCSSSSCSSCSDSSCSCHEHSDTSYESTDNLTDLPRAKTRARRLGKMAGLKVADKCNQS